MQFLKDYHFHNISRSTLLRRLKLYDLRRRSGKYLPVETIQSAREQIQADLNGPGSSNGYRAVWHSLRVKGIHVPCYFVQKLIKEIDPEGTHVKKHRLEQILGPKTV